MRSCLGTRGVFSPSGMAGEGEEAVLVPEAQAVDEEREVRPLLSGEALDEVTVTTMSSSESESVSWLKRVTARAVMVVMVCDWDERE